MFWDEDNRLMVLSDNGKTSRYTYNAGGERIIKSHGSMEGVYINGAPQGITFHETDEFTLYPASIITVNRHRFTKHYFIGDKRVASRLGLGEFRNVYGSNGNNVTAGQQDYAERMNQIEQKREEYYKLAGVAPGLPTMKGSYADPEVTGRGYNELITEIGDHRVPENWVQRPVVNTEEGTNPGAPLAWGSPENPDDVVAGYGYVAADTSEVEETFYYHSDHLGSTSYITDQQANVTQYDAYLPYGELLVDEHSSSADLPYKFNGKELDEETGLYYYGARYMNPVTSMWYGVDQLTEKYHTIGSYVYCMGHPVKFIDPNGKDIIPTLVLGWKYNEKTRTTEAIQKNHRSTHGFMRAMNLIGQTCFGKYIISSFLSKGQNQYGVSGQGQYSDYVLQITEANCANPGDQEEVLGVNQGTGKTFGYLHIGEDGDKNHRYLRIEIGIDVRRNFDDMLATLVHEIALHGSAIDAIVQAYKEGGIDKAKKVYDELSVDDHKNLKNHNRSQSDYKTYESMKKELINKDPSLKKAFERAAKRAKEQY